MSFFELLIQDAQVVSFLLADDFVAAEEFEITSLMSEFLVGTKIKLRSRGINFPLPMPRKGGLVIPRGREILC